MEGDTVLCKGVLSTTAQKKLEKVKEKYKRMRVKERRWKARQKGK